MVAIYDYGCAEGKAGVSALLTKSRAFGSDVEKVVREIIDNVRQNGDYALFEYTRKFDGHELTAQTMKVSCKEVEQAMSAVDHELLEIIRRAAERITAFHMREKRNGWLEASKNGEILGQILRPLERAGVYVPGGKAAYPSSVLMNIIPAKVAGVKYIAAATPAPNGEIQPAVLAAAVTAGVDEIYKIGGAQAVAAFAYGTQSIPKVDKIVGPGNIYVASAKKSVFGTVGIDSFAGPSEILIIADETADPVFIAADMLSQAEHDELARAILITTSEELAKFVQKELKRQMSLMERKAIIKDALKNNGAIIVAKSLEEAADISNFIAPEHLEICTQEPFSLLPRIHSAGAVFLGHYSPEPLGDYMAGPNHVLPTNGSARFFSPLSVDDFMKKTSVISFSKEALAELSGDIIRFASSEGLTAHANAIKVRGES